MKKIIDFLLDILKKLFETLFFIIKILIDRFLKPLIIFIILLVYITINNWVYITKTFQHFTLKDYELIRDFLALVLSWPVVVFVITLIFIFKFKDSIKIFLENLNFLKAGPVEIGQRQQIPTSTDIENRVTANLQQKGITLTEDQLKKIEEAFQEKENILTDKNRSIEYLLERAELFEFAYLGLGLVNNTKSVLFWFYLQTSHSSTKDNFIMSYTLPPQIINPLAEKEAIFNALLVNQLIEQNNSLFTVSLKGKRFLKYLGFNIND
jgi:hypothetical protein